MVAAIETDDLTKDFLVGFWRPRPYRAVDHLTLRVGAGEIFGFLGPNGAGKSTTIKLLMQLLYPTHGSARILGRPVGDVSVRRRIGFLAENPYYYDHLTAEELLGYFARLGGIRGAEAGARVGRVLDEVGLGAERRLRLRRYSKGMIQRVGLAQALITDPEVLLLDEPMSGLDPLGRKRVREIILRLRSRGCTVLFSSHILSDAEVLCSQVAILAQGRVVAQGRMSEILAFELKGWELVVTHVPDELRAELDRRATHVLPLSDGRYSLTLPPDPPPAGLMCELERKGVRMVSLNPVRETLEDLFVQSVGVATPRSTGGL